MERFGGIQRLYGKQQYLQLKNQHVCIIGIGGVGSWVAEALARSGIEYISLVDLDDICISNTNRQLHALSSNIGKSKVLTMKERILDINPNCQVNCIEDFLTQQTSLQILNSNFDVVVDAIDSLQHKCELVLKSKELGFNLLSIGAAGGRRDPTKIQLEDLSNSVQDPLLSKLRKRLRQKHNFPRTGKMYINCVFSTEPPVFPSQNICITKDKAKAQNLKLDCETGLGTASFVTGSFGFVAAFKVIDLLLNK